MSNMDEYGIMKSKNKRGYLTIRCWEHRMAHADDPPSTQVLRPK